MTRSPPEECAACKKYDEASAFVANTEYLDHTIKVPTRQGGSTIWIVRARELPWDEQSNLTEKYTKHVQPRGGDARTEIKQTLVMSELLDRMIRGPDCNPPVSQEHLRKLRGPILKAVTDHFHLNTDEQKESEIEAGESDAL